MGNAVVAQKERTPHADLHCVDLDIQFLYIFSENDQRLFTLAGGIHHHHEERQLSAVKKKRSVHASA